MLPLKSRARRIRNNVSAPAVTTLLGLGEGPKIPCPFHQDNDPSMHVYPNYLKCYGTCDKGFSVIDLVMHQQNLSLKEALEWIEERFNMDPESISPDEESPEVFTRYLWGQAEAQIAQMVRIWFLQNPDKEEEVEKIYAFWDRVVQQAKERGESPTKILDRASTKIRKHMK